MRRIILLVLAVIVLLSIPGAGHSTFWWEMKSVRPVALPRGYEHCSWEGFADFAFYRDKIIPGLWASRKLADYSLNASLGYLIGGYFWGEEAAQAIRAGIVISYLGNASTDITGSTIDRVLGSGGSNPSALIEQANRLSNELGISDHYVFGGLTCPQGHEIMPLGAFVYLTMLPEQRRPALLKVARPEIDFGRLDARVSESNLNLEAYQYSSIRKIFGYESIMGKRIPGPNNRMWPLPVTNTGKVTGKIPLSNVQGLGYTGIREISLASPVNRGMLKPDITDTLPVIILNQETVLMKVLNPQDVEAGKNLHLGVHIRNFHPGTRMDPALPYFGFANWQKMADAAFEGITCRGAGVSRTVFQLNPGFTHTDVWCTPFNAGNVQLFMKTLDGEVLVGSVTVPPAKVSPKPNIEYKPGPIVPPKKTLSPDGILGLWYATTSGKAPLKIWKEGDTYLGMITGPGGNGYGWKRDVVSFRLKFQKQEGNSLVYSGKHNQKVGNPYDNFSEWRDITLSYFLVGTEEVFGSVMISGGERFKRQPGR